MWIALHKEVEDISKGSLYLRSHSITNTVQYVISVSFRLSSAYLLISWFNWIVALFPTLIHTHTLLRCILTTYHQYNVSSPLYLIRIRNINIMSVHIRLCSSVSQSLKNRKTEKIIDQNVNCQVNRCHSSWS